MRASSRFCIGIDLGTTNCAVAYFDRERNNCPIQLFRIPQFGANEYEEQLPLLPSCIFLDETKGQIIGKWALTQGEKLPTRLIQSAKSWLSNPAAHRKEKILPFDASQPDKRLSPVEASACFLAHIRDMWNRQMSEGNARYILEEQEIILTVPASFDELARTLTVEAAACAGLKNLTLLEEPQAAFYNWIMENGMAGFREGESILVCDVGGGTTDFTIIDALLEKEKVVLRRMAVGKHLLLGGDNMDAAITHFLESRLPSNSNDLDLTQRLSLRNQARTAKESLLKHPGEEKCLISISGKGSKVIGGSLHLEITRQEVVDLLLEGFFGIYSFEEAIQLKKGSGIRQMGLPFESEPSIVKHLAHFLYKTHRKPTYLLFNGGAMKPLIFQNRIARALNKWFGEKSQVQILHSSSLDLAVAKGAAYFGKARQGEGTFISGGTPRTYYLEIALLNEIPHTLKPDLGRQGSKALTVLPRGAVEGSHLITEHQFSLMPNQPITFQFFHSHTRLNDCTGDLIIVDEEELMPLPPLQTICQYGQKGQTEAIPVQLEITLTSIGTLELWVLSKNTPHKWKLEFQVTKEIQEKRLLDETFELSYLEPALKEIEEAFAVGSSNKLNTLMARLETLLEMERNAWSPSLLRGLYEPLSRQADKRLLSSAYEGRFWNLTGFFLRPGIGYPLDDYRLKQLWKIILADLKKPKSEEALLQQWICYRRIAAGLSKGCQVQLFHELQCAKHNNKKGYVYAEHLRALASFELVDVAAKIKLGETLIKKIGEGRGEPCDYWSLGRLGARQLFHGTAANVIPAKICESWIEKLLAPVAQNNNLPFTLTLLARKTGCPEIDLPNSLLEKVAPYLTHLQNVLFNERSFTPQEQDRFFGDSLPPGLCIID